jgi:hypothetical protein
MTEMGHDAHVQDLVHFLLQHLDWQPERRNLGTHHAAALRVLLEQVDLVAVGEKVPGHGQRCGPGPDAGDPLAVLDGGDLGQVGGDVAPIVGGDPLQATDGNGLFFGAHAPAGGLAGPVAGAPQNAGKDVRVPVEHVRFRVPLLGNQADVLGHGGVRGARPLAIHHLVEVVGIEDIG